MGQDPHEHKLLIEFKRPNATVGREAEGQAKTYRDELTPHFGHMRILVVGGTVDAAMSAEYQETDLKFTTYNALISSARSQLEWLLRDLNEA